MKYSHALSGLTRTSLSLFVTSFALAACGSQSPLGSAVEDGASHDAAVSETSAPGDAAAQDAARDVQPDLPFETATHNPLPQVTNVGGPVLSNVQLVVITYADDTNRSSLEMFGNWIGTSNWLQTVGPEYGIGAGSVLGVVELPQNAPTSVTSTDIESMIAQGISAGTLPTPANHNLSNVLYMVFYPSTTSIALVDPTGQSSQSCQDFDGFHSEVQRGGLHAAYAVVADCGGYGSELDSETVTASHEYFEAATDPFPMSNAAFVLPANYTTAWGLIGGELGDLCEMSHSTYYDSGYAVQRIYSDRAAAANEDPCIPTDPTRPYFNVSVDQEVQYASPGDTVTFNLTGWSTVPMNAWRLSVHERFGNVSLTTALDTSNMTNGGTATLTVRVPTSAQNGMATYLISSSVMASHLFEVYPVAVIVER